MHGVFALFWVSSIPFTKAVHMLAGPAGVAAKDERAGNALPPLPADAKPEEVGYATIDALAQEGCEIEVIDLRSIQPWDHELVAESVRRTHRLLVVHEDTITAGFGAEIAAWVASELFCDLDAPVMRVGALDCHVPYAPEIERAVLPQNDDIEAAARRLLAF